MPRTNETIAVALQRLPESVELHAAFSILRRGRHPWLLESGCGPAAPRPSLARWSFAGAEPYLVLRAYGRRSELEWRRAFGVGTSPGREIREGRVLDVFASLMPSKPGSIVIAGEGPASVETPLPPFLGGAVGVLGYELAEETEPVALHARNDLQLPDLVMLFVDRVFALDHESGTPWAIGLGIGDGVEAAEAVASERAASLAAEVGRAIGSRVPPMVEGLVLPPETPEALRELLETPVPEGARSDFDAPGYAAAVEAIRSEIVQGNVYQANLTQRVDLEPAAFRKAGDGDLGWALHRVLRRLSPSPFSALIELPECAVVSSSPERFLLLDREGGVESRPIKGTRPRGATSGEDALLEKELAESEKDRAENLMIVDLVRNDLGRVCEMGSVSVPELMTIERYATVFQMVSSVRGRLSPGRSPTDLLRATFPPGSMTGAPKIAAMRIIDDLEPVRRGFYSGAIGYFDVLGGLDLSVVIRTLFVRHGRIHLHGGGGVVNDSDPHAEYEESLSKLRAPLAAVRAVEESLASEPETGDDG